MSGPPAGWYPDPDDDTKLAWWDGDKWTQGAPKMPASAVPATPVPVSAPVAAAPQVGQYAAPQFTTNGSAVASLVLSILAWITPFVIAPVGVVIAIIAIAAGAGGVTRSNLAGGRGHSLAVAGILVGSLALLVNAVAAIRLGLSG